MIQTIGDYLSPIMDFIIQFLLSILSLLCNPIIASIIAFYIMVVIVRWYLKRLKEQRELEALQKPTYEMLNQRNIELEEEIRHLRRKIRARAFRD